MSSAKGLPPLPRPFSFSTPDLSLPKSPTALSGTSFLDVSASSLKYNAPRNYRIGVYYNIQPRVAIQHLKSHLRLMKAFRELRDQVESSAVGEEVGDTRIIFVGEDAAQTEAAVKKMSKSRRWEWIVGLAVERYVSYISDMMLLICEDNIDSSVGWRRCDLQHLTLLHGFAKKCLH